MSLNDFRVLEKLGAGSFATVYKVSLHLRDCDCHAALASPACVVGHTAAGGAQKRQSHVRVEARQDFSDEPTRNL